MKINGEIVFISNIWSFPCALAIIIIGACSSTYVKSSGVGSINQIHLFCQEIKRVVDSNDRADFSKALFNYVSKLSVDEIQEVDDDSVDCLSNLLLDKNGTVAYYSALMLQKFGKRAERSVPYIKKAIVEDKRNNEKAWVKPTKPFSTVLCKTLLKVSGKDSIESICID